MMLLRVLRGGWYHERAPSQLIPEFRFMLHLKSRNRGCGFRFVVRR